MRADIFNIIHDTHQHQIAFNDIGDDRLDDITIKLSGAHCSGIDDDRLVGSASSWWRKITNPKIKKERKKRGK